MVDIIKAYAVKNLCYIAAQKMVPKGIVVHSTGANNPNLKRYVDAPEQLGANQYANHWNVPKPDGQMVCVHAFIGYDKNNKIKVAEILPLDICCWGVGNGSKGSYNYNPAYIQFEICEDALTDKNYYNNAFNVAAEYCAGLCKTYGISTKNIVGHCEAYKLGYGSNHSDPEHWMKKFGENMDDFRNKVLTFINNNSQKTNTQNVLIENGDLVSIASNAVYYNGVAVPAWVKAQNWYVYGSPSGDRVVINKNEKNTNAICSPINKKYLTIVKKATKAANTKPQNGAASACPYLVKVTASSLNIRKGAGTNTQIMGSITDNGVYTIVEEKLDSYSNKWGKLKSGAGWISLDYVTKL